MTWSGIWPVAPTPFHADGTLDLDGMRRVLDCLIDQGADGICVLANFSEQFLLSDAERGTLTRLSLEHVAGRVPVIVTISHFATQIAVDRARLAKSLGADIVMMMPPYHGALLKGTPDQTYEQFAAVGEVGIPIMVQDAPLSGVDLPVPLLVRMAREIEMVKLFKIECPQAANKLRALIAEGGAAIEAPFDGEEGITLLADLDAGATGSMTSGMIVDQIKPDRGLWPRRHGDQPREPAMRLAVDQGGDGGRRCDPVRVLPPSDRAAASGDPVAADRPAAAAGSGRAEMGEVSG